ncbi:uncharacterized protein CEXT_74631 [Caerostris extrusa]|uniref:Uncharacterized protein n=1 Tax=Caerostris extrusa TaxID=172846 RepID=A0AAV4TBW5_CAEEX|nr:uncharacterized protein CEXT_74631 [Caerostris extrusa]
MHYYFFLLWPLLLSRPPYGEALDSQQISDTIEDLLRLESSNPETIVKPNARADEPIVEESKDSVVFRSSKRLKKNSPGYKIKGTSYSEGYSHDHDHDHIRYYSGDDQPPEDTRYNEGMIHSFHHQGSSDVDLQSDKPRSTNLGKSRRKRAKNRVHRGRDNSSPKPSSGFTPLLPPLGFSAERLHGIGTYFSSQRTKGNENHFHLHNHHHYKPDEKKFSERDPMESYDKIFKSLGKLRNVIPTMLSGMAGALPQLSQGQTSTSPGSDVPKVMNADVKFATEGEKRGYHYTGPHKAYGRKTYIRMKNENEESGDPNTDYPSSYEDQQAETGGYGYETSNSRPNYPESEMNMHDHAVDMFKYGTGPYGTDEYRDGKGRFPNEVNLNVDKIHPGIGFDSPPGGAPHSDTILNLLDLTYHTMIIHPVFIQIEIKNPERENILQTIKKKLLTFHTIKSKQAEINLLKRISRPTQRTRKSAFLQQTRRSTFLQWTKSPHSYDGPESPHSYDGPSEGKSYSDSPIHSSAEGHSGSPHVTSHTVSYSHQGDRVTDSHHLEPQEELFRNARPDLDPLSIPRNAQIIEHFIRLDPVHYTPPRIPMEFIPGAGFQVPPAPPGAGFQVPQRHQVLALQVPKLLVLVFTLKTLGHTFQYTS